MKQLIRSAMGRVFVLARAWTWATAPALIERARRTAGLEGVLQLLEDSSGNTAVALLQKMGATVGSGVRIHRGLTLHNVEAGVLPLHIGDGCHIGRQVFVDLAEQVSVGQRVTIAMRVMIITHMSSGDSRVWSGTSRERKRPVIIEDDVYVGAGAILLPGVQLKRGSLIGAGAVVTRDVPEGAIVVGVPAARIRSKADA